MTLLILRRQMVRFAYVCSAIVLGMSSTVPTASPVAAAAINAPLQRPAEAVQQQITPPEVDLAPQKTLTDFPALGGTVDLSNIEPSSVVLPQADAVLEIPSTKTRVSAAQSQQRQTLRLDNRSQFGAFNATATFLTTNNPEDQNGNLLSPVGVAFTFNLDEASRDVIAQSPSGSIKIGVDYSNVDMPIGGDFQERLSLYEGHDCRFAEDGSVTSCAIIVPLRG